MMDSVETLARNLVSVVLRTGDWADRLDDRLAALHRAARRIRPDGHMAAAVRRAEAILRDMVRLDAATIGRLYFDLLPRQPDHPLTAAVAAALSDRDVVLAMLRAAGISPRLLKDGDGTTFIVLEGLDEAEALSDGMKEAIRAAMTVAAPAPRGGLHTVH